jgi:hypothetical protein
MPCLANLICLISFLQASHDFLIPFPLTSLKISCTSVGGVSYTLLLWYIALLDILEDPAST